MLRTSSIALSFEDLVLYLSIPVPIVKVDAHGVDSNVPNWKPSLSCCRSNESLSLASSVPRLGPKDDQGVSPIHPPTRFE